MAPQWVQRLSLSLALSAVLAGAGCASLPKTKAITRLPTSPEMATEHPAGDTGLASWYGEEHRGQLMANGRPFDPDAFTAASWFYPLGTRVRVTCGSEQVVVEIADRGPAKRLVQQGRVIDLSRAAFLRLADPRRGLIPVTVRPLP